MLRSSSVCLSCQVKVLSKIWTNPTWQTSRAAATLQKRRPSRMTLASDVKGTRRDGEKKARSSPFGGMNKTEAPRKLDFYAEKNNRTSPAAQRRGTRQATSSRGSPSLRERNAAPVEQRRVTRDTSPAEGIDSFGVRSKVSSVEQRRPMGRETSSRGNTFAQGRAVAPAGHRRTTRYPASAEGTGFSNVNNRVSPAEQRRVTRNTSMSNGGVPYEKHGRVSPVEQRRATRDTAPLNSVGAFGPRSRVPSAEQRRVTSFPRTSKSGPPNKNHGRDPMKAMKMQRQLANVSYEKRGRIQDTLAERDSFDDFNLLRVVKESVAAHALQGMVNVTPTPIQRLAIPALLGTEDAKGKKKGSQDDASGKKEMQQYLLAAETGSGKTLAYLLPIIDAVKRAEATERATDIRSAAKAERQQRRGNSDSNRRMFELQAPEATEPDPTTARPRAIILLPTAELIDQVGAVLKLMSHTCKFRSALLSSNYSGKVIRSRLFSTQGIDIVVSTPHLLSSITESDPNILSRVTHLVVDEADSLLDRGFSPITSELIDRASPSLEQLILCSATIPRSLDKYLEKRYPDVRRLVTPKLHSIPRRVQLSVVDVAKVPYQGNRDLACAQVIWDIGKEGREADDDDSSVAGAEKKLIVFVNEREKTVEVAEYLKKKGIDAVALSRDSAERDTTEILSSFTGSIATTALSDLQQRKMLASQARSETAISPAELPHHAPTPSTHPQISGRRLLGTKVLVTTDIASRGIDTTAVRHVVLYDVPHTSIDFIHRLGRVGRMNRRGRGVVLVGKGDRRDVVKEVRDGMFKGQALI